MVHFIDIQLNINLQIPCIDLFQQGFTVSTLFFHGPIGLEPLVRVCSDETPDPDPAPGLYLTWSICKNNEWTRKVDTHNYRGSPTKYSSLSVYVHLSSTSVSHMDLIFWNNSLSYRSTNFIKNIILTLGHLCPNKKNKSSWI